jgi:arthrofactin-type cyclic lipopeptide synthetase C
LFNHLAAAAPDAFHSFRFVLVGGEAVDPKWFARVFRSGYRGRLVNAYGPTEATTFSICNVLSSWESEVGTVPIGRPIANTTAYVLDSGLRPVPPGIVGEICVGGDGVALGYINDEAATREKFVPNPFRPGTRLYRTGDLGRYRSNGEIDCLGRTDRQLKIRGFRIEPAEIESALKKHPAVDQAAVISVAESNDRTLCAYVVLAQGSFISGTELRGWLKSRLPAYLLPASVITMDALPLTANGKLDHAKLTSPRVERRKRAGTRRLCTPMESLAMSAWQKILGLPEIMPEDSFFDLGGTSLLAVQMLSELERELARTIPVALILRWPTLEAFAQALEIRPVQDSRLFCIREGNPQLTPVVLVHGGADFRHVLQALTIENPVWTLSLPAEAEISDPPNMQQLASLYVEELQCAFPSRPPVIAGYCLSGMIGFEIARQLCGFHREAGGVVLFDVPSPPYYWSRPWSKRIGEAGSYFAYLWKIWSGLSTAKKSSSVRDATRKLRLRATGGREDYIATTSLTTRYLRAAQSYRPDHYPGRIVLLRASLRPVSDAHLGWTAFASQVEVLDTPSTHANALEPPHARRAAEALATAVSQI